MAKPPVDALAAVEQACGVLKTQGVKPDIQDKAMRLLDAALNALLKEYGVK